jgi:putative transposase
MPAKNRQKIYLPNATYHIYNRGAFKMEIYKEKADYEYFYSLLWQEQRSKDVVINVESVLPNHFHLQFFQRYPRDIQKFMTSLSTRYALYFCKKYDHSGYVFQGSYKAVLKMGLNKIRENTEYILNNPKEAGLEPWPYVGRFSKWRENYL